MFADLGFSGCRDWTEEKQEQACTLWRELGRDVDPNAQLPANVPCAVISWRDQWTPATCEGNELPHLLHSSGYAIRFTHTASFAGERPIWTRFLSYDSLDEMLAIGAKLGAAQIERLEQEAEFLWMDMGFFDASLTQVAKPFSDDWRTLWRVSENNGEQWLVHVCGLAWTPVFGVVEEDGLQAWTLQLRPGDACTLDSHMRRRVGQKAWDRVHDQAWQLCIELGYVTSH